MFFSALPSKQTSFNDLVTFGLWHGASIDTLDIVSNVNERIKIPYHEWSKTNFIRDPTDSYQLNTNDSFISFVIIAEKKRSESICGFVCILRGLFTKAETKKCV